ncbi:phytanoyl-CoA dioxygenase family protein [Streptosporangium sp. NPDC051023]|uniref:phytanoyl-CoA dioxygenase family protein n=1 Tax=Streptosporangium sp. NPDC051023 TaxID=3155410 RepID=UPI00344C374D
MELVTLNDLQVRHFRDSGYLRLPGVLGPDDCHRLATFVADQHQAAGGGKLYGLLDRDPLAIGGLIAHPRLIGPLTSLLGPNIVYITNRHNHATLNPPGQTENRLHRDILQWTRGVLTVVVYLEEATVGNGATQIIPGSHYLPSMGVPQLDGGGTWMDEHDRYAGLDAQALPVPVAAGDALIFDGLVFHTAGTNSGRGTRASLTLGYRSIDELDRRPAPEDQVLVAGEFSYRGNN